MSEPITQFQAGELAVQVHSGTAEMGQAAAVRAAAVIRDAVARTGRARAVFATGNSQFAFVQALQSQDVPWDRVTAFHLDEYVGIDANHPASFRRWIRERIEEPLQPEQVHYIDGDAPDPEAECRRYEDLLRAAPLDVVCMGIGENGHIAFNEPNEADFADQRLARVITLTPESRAQQVGEGHFPDDAAVPATAISLTVPALLSGAQVLVCTPDRRKAAAVAAAINAEISPACPATILRTAGHATLFLDPESAGQLEVPVG